MDELSVAMVTSSITAVCSLTVVAFKVLWPWRGQARGLLAQCWHRLRCRTQAPEDADVERRVREESLRRRGERAAFFLVLFSVLSTYFSLTHLASAAGGKLAAPLPSLLVVHVNLLIKYAIALLPKIHPRLADAVYCQSIVNMSATVLLGPASLGPWRILRLMQLFYWGVFDLKPWLNAAGAVTLLLAEALASVQAGLPLQPLIPASVAYFSATLALVGINHCIEQSVRFQILATDSKSELAAVQTLLDSICDVVLQLDNKLRLKQHSPKLLDVLLQPPCRNTVGTDLREYMATNEDREVFTEQVHMKNETTAQASVFHARLRDSLRSNIAMEFFAVGFKSHDGSQHHIVGMREHTDIQPLANMHREPPPPPPPPVEVAAPRRGHEEGQGQAQPQRGTPSSLEQGDLRTHRSDSASRSGLASADGRSDSDSDSNGSFEGGGRSLTAGEGDITVRIPQAVVPVAAIETSEIAKIVTTNYLLMSWVVGMSKYSCCPKHAAVASLQRVAALLAGQDCMPDYGPVTEWQCRRCGIMGDEHRNPERRKSRRCLICKDLDSTNFEGDRRGGTATL